MAYFSFTRRILAGEPIQIFNKGDLYRDFTYIDDIVSGLKKVIFHPPAKNVVGTHFKVYNMGNHRSVQLLHFIEILEDKLGVKAKKQFLPMQPGDVYQTYVDVNELMRDFGYAPDIPIEIGLEHFVRWYKEYYHV